MSFVIFVSSMIMQIVSGQESHKYQVSSHLIVNTISSNILDNSRNQRHENKIHKRCKRKEILYSCRLYGSGTISGTHIYLRWTLSLPLFSQSIFHRRWVDSKMCKSYPNDISYHPSISVWVLLFSSLRMKYIVYLLNISFFNICKLIFL